MCIFLSFLNSEFTYILMSAILSQYFLHHIGFLMLRRHQLVPDEELGPLYDLLIDDPPEIRRAIGALVYDHLIAQKFQSSQSTGFFHLILYILYISLLSIHSYLKCFTGGSSDSSEIHLKRMLQILAEFSTDQILSKYVIDDVWEYMDAMKVRLLIEQLN